VEELQHLVEELLEPQILVMVDKVRFKLPQLVPVVLE
jgi:hypothetical protein